MEKEIEQIVVDSGTLLRRTYTYADYKKNPGIKGVIKDIYEGAPGFAEEIDWIITVNPLSGKTIEDVLHEYTEEYGQDRFIMCSAGTLTPAPEGDVVYDMLQHIEQEKGYILNADFYNIFFNRKMIHSYGAGNYCVFSNDKTEDFIRNNMGPDKIINRVMSSGKL